MGLCALLLCVSSQALEINQASVAELDSLRRAETHRIKSFISARVDRFRPPFGRQR